MKKPHLIFRFFSSVSVFLVLFYTRSSFVYVSSMLRRWLRDIPWWEFQGRGSYYSSFPLFSFASRSWISVSLSWKITFSFRLLYRLLFKIHKTPKWRSLASTKTIPILQFNVPFCSNHIKKDRESLWFIRYIVLPSLYFSLLRSPSAAPPHLFQISSTSTHQSSTSQSPHRHAVPVTYGSHATFLICLYSVTKQWEWKVRSFVWTSHFLLLVRVRTYLLSNLLLLSISSFSGIWNVTSYWPDRPVVINASFGASGDSTTLANLNVRRSFPSPGRDEFVCWREIDIDET